MYQELKVRDPFKSCLWWGYCIVIFILVNLMLMVGISCVDHNNCLRGWCNISVLKSSFREYVEQNCKVN